MRRLRDLKRDVGLVQGFCLVGEELQIAVQDPLVELAAHSGRQGKRPATADAVGEKQIGRTNRPRRVRSRVHAQFDAAPPRLVDDSELDRVLAGSASTVLK